MPGPETGPDLGGEGASDGDRYSPEEAQQEASQMKDKIESGEAKNYEEAEQLIEKTVEGLDEKQKRNVLLGIRGIVGDVIQNLPSALKEAATFAGKGVVDFITTPVGVSVAEHAQAKERERWREALKKSGLPEYLAQLEKDEKEGGMPRE